MTDSRRPTRLAGMTNTGRMIRLIRVICQDRKNITIRTSVTLIRLETTDDRVSVNACWAPMTSLLSRLISAPVWVRVKKAMGILWMCSNTLDRMSKISPSPTLADTHRMPMVSPVSTMATTAATRASPMISGLLCSGMPVVDDGAEQQRVDDPDDRVDDHQHQKPGQDLPVGPGELDHPPGGALGHVLLGHRVVAAHRPHHPAELAAAHPVTAIPMLMGGYRGSGSCPGPYRSVAAQPTRPRP